MLRGRDEELARLREAGAADQFTVASIWGGSGSGKTALLLEARERAEVEGWPQCYVDIEMQGSDTRSLVAGLISPLMGAPARLKPTRTMLLLVALGQARPAGEPDLFGGAAGALATALGLEAVAQSADALVRGARGLAQAAREAAVDQWMAERFGPQWRNTLGSQPPRRLYDQLIPAVAADLTRRFSTYPDPLWLLLDGLKIGSPLESAVHQLAVTLEEARVSCILAVTSLGPLGWTPNSPTRSGEPTVANPLLPVIELELPELSPPDAIAMCQDAGLPEATADLLVARLGGLPAALAYASQVLLRPFADNPNPDPRVLEAMLASAEDAAAEQHLESLSRHLDYLQREFLQAIALPDWFPAALSYELHPQGHDALFRGLVRIGIIRQAAIADFREPIYRLHALVRRALLATGWPAGPEAESRRKRVTDWFAREVPDPQQAPLLLAIERLRWWAEVEPRAALAASVARIEKERTAYRLAAGRAVADAVRRELDDKQQAELGLAVGRLDLEAGAYAAAIKTFEQAHELIHDGEEHLVLPTLQHLAEAHRLAGNSTEAGRLFKALEQTEPDGTQLHEEARFRGSWGLTLTEAQRDEMISAWKYLRFARKQSKRVVEHRDEEPQIWLDSHASLQRRLLRHEARLLRARGDYAAASAVAAKALAKYENEAEQGRLYVELELVRLSIDEGDPMAADRAQAVAQRFKELGDVRGYAMSLVSLISTRLLTSQVDQAREGISELRAARDAYPFAVAYAGLAEGELCRRLGDDSRALLFYQEVRPATTAADSRIEAAVADLGLAQVLVALGSEEDALLSAKEGRRAAEECGYKVVTVWGDAVLAEVERDQKTRHLEAAAAGLAALRTNHRDQLPEHQMLRDAAEGKPVWLRAP